MFNTFKTSTKKLKSTRSLAILALLIAIKVVISSLYIPVGDNLRVYFSFFISVLQAAMFGPTVAFLFGIVSDLVGFIFFPSGPFFIGYTLTPAISGLIYALFLYNKEITVLKLGISKFLVNMIVNVGLGSLWSSILYSNVYMYYFAKSLVDRKSVV